MIGLTQVNSSAQDIVSSSWAHELVVSSIVGLVVFVVIRFFLKAWVRRFVDFVLRLFGVRKPYNDNTFLELTFPSDTSKSAFATEQLHILLGSLIQYRTLLDRITSYKKPYSLELVATKDDGIRYILLIPTVEVQTVQRTLLSFLPGIKIREIADYLADLTSLSASVVEYRQSANFVLPIQGHSTLKEHDPIAVLTGHMTKLCGDELISFQIVTTPILGHSHPQVQLQIKNLKHKISRGKAISPQLFNPLRGIPQILGILLIAPVWLIVAVAKLIGEFLPEVLLPRYQSPSRPTQIPQPIPRSINPYEQELGAIVKSKLDQLLFEVSIRVLVVSATENVTKNRLNSFASSFQPFATSYQSIRKRRKLPLTSSSERLFNRFKQRSLTPRLFSQQTVLSSSELSDLYHFPETDLTQTEGFLKSRSRELPSPLSLKHSGLELDVKVGINRHGGEVHPIGMTLEQRQKHTYVIGKTGTGKTTLLTGSIYQDMVNGKGLAVLDPHGDMFQELLEIVPEHRLKDVIVFDPSDRKFPLGLNILDPGIEFANEDDKHDWITSSVLSVFVKLADKNQWGPRMEHILRNATLTALQVPNPSLYTLQRLLTDKKYQKTVAATLKDPVLKQFWQKEFALLGTMQLSSVTAPLTHRLGHFITTKMSRHILLQSESTLRIADIMNEGKILLVNLAKGDIGEDQSLFFGTILTSFIWMAAYQRTKIAEKDRRDFFLYVDEFQNFASPLFSEIVSEGRKFHISLIVSHQNIAQIEDNSLVKLIAGNASTLIALKIGPEDEEFILPYMKPVVSKGDIVNLAPYHFYMKTTGEVSEDAFSGETVTLDALLSPEIKESVIASSQEKYGTPIKKVEAYMEQLFSPDGTSKKRLESVDMKVKETKKMFET